MDVLTDKRSWYRDETNSGMHSPYCDGREPGMYQSCRDENKYGTHICSYVVLLLSCCVIVSFIFPIPSAAQDMHAEKLPRDPASSSLLVMPTGRTLPAGTGTVGLAAPYIPYAAYSILDGLQLSAGGVYVFGDAVGSGEAYYSYLFVKNSLFDDGNTSIAVGAALMFWGQELARDISAKWDRATIPGVFAVTTIGDEESTLTLGLGFAELAGGFGIGFEDGFLAGIGLGYETRISPDWKFMTEHFSSVLSTGTLHTAGVRYFTGRTAFDLGIIVIPHGHIDLPSGTRMPRVLPLLGVSIHIG